MKSIGFVGKIDKTELVEYIAKIIANIGKKVIIIDATSMQKTRYTVPIIMSEETQNQYVVQHDGVDFAVGFSNILELKKYLISKGEDFAEYEYVLIDTDVEEMCEEYDLKSANSLFFVTSYDKMYIIKGIDLLRYLCAMKRRTNTEATIDICKLLYYSDINTADSAYIDRLTENLPINWIGGPINVPYDSGDLSVNIRNQYSNKIDFKYLSKMYKNAVIDAANTITGEDKNNLRKTIKNIEKSNKFSS